MYQFYEDWAYGHYFSSDHCLLCNGDDGDNRGNALNGKVREKDQDSFAGV
jgi:hypothetical protein